MATKGEMTGRLDTVEIYNPNDKAEFLLQFLQKNKELVKRQRDYKEILATPYKTRKHTIIQKSLKQATARLRQEREDIRAQIWVADNSQHAKEDKLYLEKIKCAARCQVELAKEIKKLRKDIKNMERGTQRMSKEIYDLNRKIVPESQHQAYVASARKKLEMLNNRLEIGIRQECNFTAKNTQLRGELYKILYERKRFHDTYSKYMQVLNHDKKTLITLMECTFNVFENCIDIYEKMELVNGKKNKEMEAQKLDLQNLRRNNAAFKIVEDFVSAKYRVRPLADLPSTEYNRREKFKNTHIRKINLYKGVLNKLYDFTETRDVSRINERFNEHQFLYYSLFTYANEIGYHATLLNSSISNLYANIENVKASEERDSDGQRDVIKRLKIELERKRKRNYELDMMLEAKNEHLKKLFSDLKSIVVECKMDRSSFFDRLGNYENINPANLYRFTKLLETRLSDIVAHVYCEEQADPTLPMDKQVVKGIDKFIDYPTDVREIVLTQQCPECAEVETINFEDVYDSGVQVLTIDEVKSKLHDKINQPEMQYRLHNLSQCQLQRSRQLLAKRYIN